MTGIERLITLPANAPAPGISLEAVVQLFLPPGDHELRAAVAAGVDGVFMEVHDNPKQAKSDGANALDLKNLRGVLRELMAIRKAVTKA